MISLTTKTGCSNISENDDVNIKKKIQLENLLIECDGKEMNIKTCCLDVDIWFAEMM
jgi:hypothetical protein